MTYNVYQGGGDRLPFIKNVIKEHDPDILAIQEACDWTTSGRFKEISHLLNISADQSALFRSNLRSSSGRIYDMAFYSRFPIQSKECLTDPKIIWHCIPYLTVQGPVTMQFILAHLCPKTENQRLTEAEQIINLTKQNKSVATVILGDLNSLSENDPYPDTLPQQLEQHQITKFGNPPRHDVVNTLKNAGLHDTLKLEEQDKTKLYISVTEASDDKDHLDLRLDYIMVNDALLNAVTKTYIVDNEITRQASDHLPIITELDF